MSIPTPPTSIDETDLKTKMTLLQSKLNDANTLRQNIQVILQRLQALQKIPSSTTTDADGNTTVVYSNPIDPATGIMMTDDRRLQIYQANYAQLLSLTGLSS